MIKAPWSAEQVDNINRFQRAGWMHPFTCPGHEGDGDRDLVATRNGLICCHCDYTQDWAHDFMAGFTTHSQDQFVSTMPAEGHKYPRSYMPGTDRFLDEIWGCLDHVKPGVIPPDVRDFIAGYWRGSISRVLAERNE